MHEINIAVLGASSVGKSSFIQRVFDHRAAPTLTVTPRKMSIDGEEYTVRLIELPFDELDFDGDNHITWPDMADSRPMPPIDGVLTLYDVMNKESLADVPETLRKSIQYCRGILRANSRPGAVYKSTLPFHLVACKCDNHPNLRHIDPTSVGQRAKALIGAVSTFETSETQPGTQKRCLFALLRVIVTTRNGTCKQLRLRLHLSPHHVIHPVDLGPSSGLRTCDDACAEFHVRSCLCRSPRGSYSASTRQLCCTSPTIRPQAFSRKL